MTENIIYRTKVYPVHYIFCDRCKKYICDSEEYDDGYYEDPSRYNQNLYLNIDNHRYDYSANLCNECKEKVTNELKDLLLNFGFKMKG